jgi:hypothetical protein
MEFLATIPVYTYPWFYNLFWAIGTTIAIIGVGCIVCAIEFRSIIPVFIGLVLIISGITGAVHSNRAIDETSVLDYNKYKVTIDETVSAHELLDKYEILSREGEIFTIKEIEVDEE